MALRDLGLEGRSQGGARAYNSRHFQPKADDSSLKQTLFERLEVAGPGGVGFEVAKRLTQLFAFIDMYKSR